MTRQSRSARLVLLVGALVAALLAASPATAAAVGRPAGQPSYNGLALTPPMGFNDWQNYRCDINENIILNSARALVSTGLARHGYDYVNVDDCWMAAQRDAAGRLQANPATFPHGIKWLAGQVHHLGLKFGIYSDAGYQTCGGFPGMYGHIQTDADTFAAWGVDYLKLDYCHQPTDQYPGLTPAQVAKIVYGQVSTALRNTHRPIVFSESAPAYFCCSGSNFTDIMSWIGQTGNLWRFGDDIQPEWSSVLTNYAEDNTPGLAAHAGPGHWNDADMLLAGTSGTKSDEQQSQFSLWAEMASPLLISADVGALPRQTVAMLSNEDVIAVDQDPLGAQGTIVQTDPNADVLAKPLAGGDVAVALFNKSATARLVSTSARTAGLSTASGYRLSDLWAHRDTETTGTIAADVPAHGVVLYRVRPAHSPSGPPALTIAPTGASWTAGTAQPLTVGVANDGARQVRAIRVALSAPAGWQVRPDTVTIPSIPAGGTAAVTFTVTPAAQPPGTSATTLTVTVGCRWGPGIPDRVTGPATATVITPYPSLATAYDNTGSTDDTDTDPAGLGPGIDNYQGTFSAQALAVAGATPGKALTIGGLTFTWPAAAAGAPDNVTAQGQIITMTGSGPTLGFLATAGFGPAGGTGTVSYTDGSTQEYTLSAPDWTSVPSGANIALSTPYHNIPGPRQLQITSDVYLATVSIDPAKTIASITLPSATGGSPLSVLHVFAITTGAAS